MPLVDTVISFGVAKASRFGLLQHPIPLTSQMATSATDRKATGRILRCGQNCPDSVFVTRERLLSTAATDILQLGRCSGVFRDERVCEWWARRIAFDGRGLCRLWRGRRIVASQSPVRIFDAAAVRSLGESALRQCAQQQHCDGGFHANSLKADTLSGSDLQPVPLFLFAGTEARLPSRVLLAWRRGYRFDLLFFRLPGLPITLLLTFGHAHSLLFLRRCSSGSTRTE
jgi:hypothetical protein